MEYPLLGGTAMFLALLAITAAVTWRQRRAWKRQLDHKQPPA